ncbi:MAG TPA: PIG-L family deacetylase [Steroidobacteraceae bacterium]|nr:PIG-L family deacetylase [Steroidobacteraceae bacterium]
MNRLTLCGAVALLAASPLAQARPPAPLPAMTPPAASDRVLVIAPHPDDETLCCAGYLQLAVRSGATVGVVWITAGDSFEIDAMLTERTLRPRSAGLEQLGLRRIAEGHAAADLLGVPRANQFLLGFPDRDIAALLQHPEAPALRSRYTGASAVPYIDALRTGDPYTGAALRANLQEIIDRFAPTIVLAPSLLDRHPDHSSSGALALELLAAHHSAAHLYFWIVHGGLDWPAPHGLHRNRALSPPRRAAALAWQQLPLDAALQAGKLSALRAHHTQMEVMSRFLNAFVRTNEIYAPAP